MEHTDELGGLQFIELRSTLPDELLMYADKLSMAHSLEVRVPYLDREVVEYVERLNAGFKVRRTSRKWLHRKVCRSFLPPPILQRKKRGFAVNVVDGWFRDATKNPSAFLENQSPLYEFVEQASCREILEGHSTGAEDYHKVLFSLLTFERWLEAA